MKVKINSKKIVDMALKGGKYFVKGCVYVVPIILAGKYGDNLSWGYSYNPQQNQSKNNNRVFLASYDDAVRAISNSDMSSFDSSSAISYIQRNKEHDYYRAIIAVAGGNQSSFDKANTIKSIATAIEA